MSCDWLNKVVELLIEYKQPIGTLFVSGVSTLFGVWLSNLSRKGQIKIYLNNEECCRCNKTTDTGKQEAVFPEADIAIYRFSLDVYNSSSDNKIIRDIFVLLCDKKKILHRGRADNVFIKSSLSEQSYNKLINIRPKELAQMNVDVRLNKDVFNFTTANCIYMEYRDEKQKKHKVLLKMYWYILRGDKDGTIWFV